ncbi:MAG: hypothetical protein J0L77_06875 [Alphaproteobacteria bacterium]|nr:hypothetical protein [Alphaproteobacteria bacterium]
MVIESKYWREDLVQYAKKFKPKIKPKRWSERNLVNFEKDIIVSMFMVRMLAERHKVSSNTTKLGLKIFRSPCIKKVNYRNQYSVDELYDFEKEESVTKDVIFVCNQLIHSGAMFAYRNENRNWDGVIACSDFERQKYVYRIPLSEVIKLLETAANDYPHEIRMTYCDKKEDYIVTTN